MATVAKERANGLAIETHHGGFDRGRRGSNRVTSPTSRNAASPERRPEELPRAASYTYLPHAKEAHYGNTQVVDIKVLPEAKYLHNHTGDADSPPVSSGCTTPDDHVPTMAAPKARDITARLRKSLSNSKRNAAGDSARTSLESSVRQSGDSQDSHHTTFTDGTTPASSPHPSAPARSFSKRFSLTSRLSSTSTTPSRSPSPQKEVTADKQDAPEEDGAAPIEGQRKSLISRTFTAKSSKGIKSKKPKQGVEEEQGSDKSATRKGKFIRRKSTPHVGSGLSKVATNGTSPTATKANGVPAVPALPKSFSTDRLPTIGSLAAIDRAAPMPKLVSPSKTHSNRPPSVTKKKDELWSVFRTLDADFAKFSSKPTSLKANVVRSSLTPFLKSYASHPSDFALRPEDLDRRTNILNKWWTGLVEMLHGRNNQSISGTDRPAILDGVLGIMERPEWRLYPSPFCPLDQRVRASFSTENRSSTSLGSTSLGSTSSDFLADSVQHNVRNIFIQNLTSQMAFVVEKMSLRNASASLVNFCGKACAYAFMFVPGMADVLVRLWELPMDVIRRVLQENGIEKFERLQESTADLQSNFPPALHQLGFTSLMQYMRKLRTPPPLPLGTNHIPWWGHWVERWSGRESDLFYVFVKQFHILTTEFLPSDTTKKERICAPGMLLVHTQILSNLDATIHRDASQIQQDSALTGPSATFDELLGDPDAIASTLPLPPINATRLMAENRLIMLIRDFLSERTAQHPTARDIFAQSFNDLLQAAARGISMFDHSACYTFLDLLEEALVILVRYEHGRDVEGSFIDAEFLQIVSRKMIESENTMTEIRLYAFLYTVWNVIVFEPARKKVLCMDLLLEKDMFESRFNHWCPMVRAYYMRLLCWRLARYDGDGDGDVQTLQKLQERLLGTWSYYLFLRESADKHGTLRPPSNPCHPAPGRRLLIVRTDNQINNAGSFLTFEGLVRDSPSQMARPAWKRTGSTNVLDGELDSRPDSSSSTMSTLDSDTESREKGLGGFLRKIMGGKNRSQPRETTSRSSVAKVVTDLSGRAQAVARAATDDGQTSTTEAAPTSPQQPPYRSLSFKFSLEFHANHKPLPAMRLFPPRLPPPAQAYLQSKSMKSYSAERTMQPVQPVGASVARARYSGRALAEWTMIVGECHSFFERRKNEGAPDNRHVESPTMGVEVFKRPS